MGSFEISGSFTFDRIHGASDRILTSKAGRRLRRAGWGGFSNFRSTSPIGKTYGVKNTLPARKAPWCTASFRQVPERPMGPLSSESRIDRNRASEARIGVTPAPYVRTTTHLGLEVLDQLVTDLINGLVVSHVEKVRNVGGYFYTS